MFNLPNTLLCVQRWQAMSYQLSYECVDKSNPLSCEC